MAQLKLHETQAISALADLLYTYLPATAHPFARDTFTLADAAKRHGLSKFWMGGSKLPALTTLLEDTWRYEPARFEPLLLTIVREGIKYRVKRGHPVTRGEMETISTQLMLLGLWVPDLADAKFLESLPHAPAGQAQNHGRPQTRAVEDQRLLELKASFARLVAAADAQQRGYELQALLGDLFAMEGLAPRGSFRLVGEEIDGSFDFQGNVYLVEARWRAALTAASGLYAFQEKVERKSAWTRGLFISVNGFTAQALEAFGRGKAARIVGMDGRDLAVILEGVYSLPEALQLKLRLLSETGAFFKELE
jgi:hypothetical protein